MRSVGWGSWGRLFGEGAEDRLRRRLTSTFTRWGRLRTRKSGQAFDAVSENTDGTGKAALRSVNARSTLRDPVCVLSALGDSVCVRYVLRDSVCVRSALAALVCVLSAPNERADVVSERCLIVHRLFLLINDERISLRTTSHSGPNSHRRCDHRPNMQAPKANSFAEKCGC